MLELAEEHIRALGITLALFRSHVRADAEFAEGLGDRDSADLVLEVAKQVDKDLWL